MGFFFPPSFLFEEQKLKEMEVDETECWILKTVKAAPRGKGDESGKCDATTVTTFSMLMMTGDEFSLIPLHVLATPGSTKTMLPYAESDSSAPDSLKRRFFFSRYRVRLHRHPGLICMSKPYPDFINWNKYHVSFDPGSRRFGAVNVVGNAPFVRRETICCCH